MAYTKNSIPDEQRLFHGQSLPLGYTTDGDASVPAGEQGISNRPGDRTDGMGAQEDESPDEDEDESELDDDDLDDDDDDEDDEDDEDEQTDPESEPGKPM